MKNRKNTIIFVTIFLLLIISGMSLGQENSLNISKSSDFSSEDLIFSRTDTLYVQVELPKIDFTNIDDMEYELKSKPDGQEIDGNFTNHFNGTYTLAIGLSETGIFTPVWELRIKVKDHFGNKFNARVPLTIGENEPPLPGTGQELEIEGFIATIQDNQIKVHQVWITLNDSTEIIDDENQPVKFENLFVGLETEVKAVQQSDGSLIAITVKVELSDAFEGEIETKGMIVETDSNSVIVDGLIFLVDENTEIMNREEEQITLLDLSVGLFVEIEGKFQEDGSLLAESIKIEEDQEQEEEFEIAGPVEEITDSIIVVAGITFYIDSDTEIKGNDDLNLSINGLQVGAFVEIEGKYKSGGKLWAKKIKIEENASSEIEEKGNIEAVNALSVTVNGIEFVVDNATVVLDDDKQDVDFNILQVGMEVEIKAIQNNDGAYLALRIKVEKERHERVKQRGRIEVLTSNSITVLQTTFFVDSTTAIEDEDNNLILFSDLQLDMMVKVEGYIDISGEVFAEEIEVKETLVEEIEVTANIDDLREGEIDVAGFTFIVTDNTIILNESKEKIVFSELQLNQFVEVKAQRLPDSTYLALRIKLEDSSSVNIEIEGSITRISGDSVVVEGLPLLTDVNTQYFNSDDNPLSLTDFTEGDFVEVEASLVNEEYFLILKMKLEEIGSLQGVVDSDSGSLPLGKLSMNKITQVNSTEFYLLNTKVLLDEKTLIVGLFNTLLDESYINSGAIVEVQGTLTSAGDLTAKSVKVYSSTVTGINNNDDSNLPSKFTLEQNYPNPFNPSTIIEFSIPQNAFVKLNIYNILGQKVSTLINESMQAGSYKVNFNATNLSTGVYFYELKSGGLNVVKKMNLLK